MYVVHQASCSVYPIWVYTHEEYPKRPSDQELKEQFAIIEEMNIVDVDSLGRRAISPHLVHGVVLAIPLKPKVLREVDQLLLVQEEMLA